MLVYAAGCQATFSSRFPRSERAQEATAERNWCRIPAAVFVSCSHVKPPFNGLVATLIVVAIL